MAGSEQWLTEAEFQAVAQQLDALVQEFERLPFPQVREMAFDMLQAVDIMHREALRRLLTFLHAHGQSQLVEHAADDPIIYTLFQLYDLVPTDERKEVDTALEAIRPYIHSHGGEVEVLDVVGGVVHLRLGGACQGCSGSTMTLKRGIEAALREGFPGFKGIEVHDQASPATNGIFIPLTEVRREPPSQPSLVSLRRPIFAPVAQVADVPQGTMRAFEVQGTRVLIANVSGELYAVRNNCPGSMAPLELGSFTPPVVVCPWHNEAFDIRTGKRVDAVPQAGIGQSLAVLPIAIVDGVIQLAVNTTADAVAPGSP